MLKNEETAQIRVYKSDLYQINQIREDYRKVLGSAVSQQDVINLILMKIGDKYGQGQNPRPDSVSGNGSNITGAV